MTIRTRAIFGGLILVAYVIAFLAGRQLAPAKVVTRDVVRTQTVEVEKVHTVTVHDVAEEKAAEEKVRTITVTRYRWMPGGITEAETTTRAATDTATHETKQAHAGATTDASKASQVQTVELHSVERTTERPNWHISLTPGYQFHGDPAISLKGPFVVGASVEKRVAGPLFLGVNASTAGTVGISIGASL